MEAAAIIIICVWAFFVVINIAGLIMAIVCFGRSADTKLNVIGLLLVLLLGPFYWLYYFLSPNYCKKIL